MPRVYVEFDQLKQLGNDCNSIYTKIDAIKSDFQRSVGELDWDVKFMSDISNTANQILRKLDSHVQSLRSYQGFLYAAHDKYAKLEGGNNSLIMGSRTDGEPLVGAAVTWVIGGVSSLRGPDVKHEIHAYVEPPRQSTGGVSGQDVTRGLALGLLEGFSHVLIGGGETIPGFGVASGIAIGLVETVFAGIDKRKQGGSAQEVGVEVFSEVVYQGLRIGYTVAVGAAIGGMFTGPLAPVGIVVGAVVGAAVGLLLDAKIKEPVKAGVTAIGNTVVSGAKAVVDFFKKW